MARKDKAVITQCKKDMDSWFTSWADNNARYNFGTEFLMNTQWTDEEFSALKSSDAEPLQFNILAAILNNILGENRQNTPNMHVVAVTDDVQPEETTLRQQLVKSISVNSNAEIAYQTATQCALAGGYGAFLVDTQYESETSLHQEVVIKRIDDPTKCFWDPSAKHIAKVDGLYCGYFYTISRGEWKARYPSLKEPANYQLPGCKYHWADSDHIMVVYYFRREFKRTTVYALDNGESMTKEDYDNLAKQAQAVGQLIPQIVIKDGEEVKRETLISKIKRYKIAGEYILEETEWPCLDLGLIFVDQNSVYIGNKQITRSFFKDAIDAQRMRNHLGTKISYLIKTARYEQWMAVDENIAGKELIWRNPQRHKGTLTYNVYVEEKTGTVFKPERLPPPELPQTLLMQYERTYQDTLTTLGIYESHLGEQGNEISGTAINARVRRSNASTIVALDNSRRAIAAAGSVVLNLIPKIYDGERTVLINTKDAGVTSIHLNKRVKNGDFDTGEVENDITKGQFKIHIEAGASFEAQKAEEREAIMQFVGLNPQGYVPLLGDLVAENINVPNNREIVNRVRTTIDPKIIAAGKGEKLPPQPEQPNPAMMMQQMQMQMAMQKMQQEQQKIDLQNKKLAQEAQLNETKAQLEAMDLLIKGDNQKLKSQTELAKAHMESQSQQAETLADLIKYHMAPEQLRRDAHHLLQEK